MEYSLYSRLFLLLNGFIHAIIKSQYASLCRWPFFDLVVKEGMNLVTFLDLVTLFALTKSVTKSRIHCNSYLSVLCDFICVFLVFTHHLLIICSWYSAVVRYVGEKWYDFYFKLSVQFLQLSKNLLKMKVTLFTSAMEL